ncbi:MAG TPA: glycosyltransferase family 4 protein [Polyangiaceae bacterium]|nr:glycosyltransferase family 4 protein [Polyangiaceae bacterium]
MRVLFVNPAATLGGSERSLLDLLASLRASVPSVTPRLLALADGELVERARELGVPTDVLPLPEGLAELGDSGSDAWGLAARTPALLRAGIAAAGFGARLRRLVRAFAPDIVHTNGMKAHLVLPAVVPEYPRVVHLRDFASERPLARRVLPLLARRSIVVTNSRAVEEDARRLAPRSRTRVVYNGVDLEEFAPRARELTHLAALAGMSVPEPESIVVGMLATFAWWKGHRTFLRAAARVLAEEPALGFRFYVVGGPIYARPGAEVTERELRQTVAELGLEPHVGFVPFQHDAAAAYRGLDIVVHPSERPEPFGRTIVEAMACERAVVAARAGGAAELFVDGETALGHRPGDASDLAAAVLRLARDAGLRSRIARAGRLAAEARFDRRRLGPELHAVYGELLAGRLR